MHLLNNKEKKQTPTETNLTNQEPSPKRTPRNISSNDLDVHISRRRNQYKSATWTQLDPQEVRYKQIRDVKKHPEPEQTQKKTWYKDTICRRSNGSHD